MGRTSIPIEELTAAEELIVEAIENGSYFVWNEVPTGLVNGVNTDFTLAKTPNPTTSLRVYVNGMLQKLGAGEDYTLSGAVITFTTAPPTNSKVTVGYTVDPN